MSQVFTAGVRRTAGGFLPYVDVSDTARGLEWEELHPVGSVPEEAQARALAEALASELRRGEPVPSPGERYRRIRETDRAPAATATARAGLASRLALHEHLLAGDRLRGWLPEPA